MNPVSGDVRPDAEDLFSRSSLVLLLRQAVVDWRERNQVSGGRTEERIRSVAVDRFCWFLWRSASTEAILRAARLPRLLKTITPASADDSTLWRCLCAGFGRRRRALSKTAFWASDTIRFGLIRHMRMASFSGGMPVILTSWTRLPWAFLLMSPIQRLPPNSFHFERMAGSPSSTIRQRSGSSK
jgi:hypothetical protein